MSNCYADPRPTFQPSMRLIASITQSNPAIITTTFAHNYKDGTVVRIDIPEIDGMQQMNGLIGTILIIDTTTFSISIDSTNFDAFSIPMDVSPHEFTCAQVVPIGEDNATLLAALQNVLPYSGE